MWPFRKKELRVESKHEQYPFVVKYKICHRQKKIELKKYEVELRMKNGAVLNATIKERHAVHETLMSLHDGEVLFKYFKHHGDRAQTHPAAQVTQHYAEPACFELPEYSDSTYRLVDMETGGEFKVRTCDIDYAVKHPPVVFEIIEVSETYLTPL
jgi:hypothetical protein